jgi:hypothetical protein
MTGSALALILIPVVGTLCLTGWLTQVCHAEGHPRQAGSRPPKPCPAALAGRRRPDACPADPADPADVAGRTPLGHPMINLDGRYRTTSRPPTTGLRPLRTDLLRIVYRSSS